MVKLQVFLLTLIVCSVSVAAPDLATMEKARTLYAKNQLTEAISVYKTIPVASDFWLDSIEERAWAYVRQGQFEEALGDLQSITSAVWSTQVGPETYMLSTFVSLKICAFKDVIKKIDLFKKRMLPRVEALQALAQQPLPEELVDMTKDLKSSKVSMSLLGTRAEKYPRYFYRDLKLINLLKTQQLGKAGDRMKDLAEIDLKEIEANLKKMKVIEVELIQKVLMADDLKQASKNLKFSAVDRDRQLIFPVTDDEIWVDEVGNFQVKAENCPYSGGSL